MGCVESRPEQGSAINIFHVVNINERGQRQKSARLEVTETHLVLHQRGRTSIFWPLRCLRRYGFDAEQFSFESGRRSPSGPGIYTFKCRRAEHLFNLLQYHIQHIAEDPSNRDGFATTHPPLALRNARNSIHAEPHTTTGAEDSHGYLSPLNRAHDNINLPTLSNSQLPSSAGSNGGVGGTFPLLSGQRPPPSPTITQAPSDAIYTNDPSISRDLLQRRLEDRDDATHSCPSNSSMDAFKRDVMGRISSIDPSATISSSERPSSYSSSGSERPFATLNHVDRGGEAGIFSIQSNAIPLHNYNGFARVPPSLHNSDTPMSLSYENIDSTKDYSRLEDFKDHPVYMNVDTDTCREHVEHVEHVQHVEHVYVNLPTDREISLPIIHPRTSRIAGSAGSGSSHSGTTTTTDTDQPHLTYIQVDVERGSDSSQTAPLSPQGSVGSVIQDFPRGIPSSYVTIDISKTEALRETAQAAAAAAGENRVIPVGLRRTRHETGFSISRHSSLIPD